MMIMALDPGTTESAMVAIDTALVRPVVHTELLPNADMRQWLTAVPLVGVSLIIEKVESYGMAVGEETFTTVYWSGIFAEAYGLHRTHQMGRKAVKLHHCGTVRATDANIRQSIIDRYGGKDKAMGKKSAPGPLFGITGHKMAALALALTWAETKSDIGQESQHG